jgi:Tfp pilus assembly protein PilV
MISEDMLAGNEAPAGSRRDGFSLVEVVVAMVLLAFVVMALGALTSVTAQRAVTLANGTGRAAFTLQETNRMMAIPYTSIDAAVGCDTITTSQLSYRRCLSFTQGTRYKEVKVIVRPLKSGSFADTVTIRRVVEAISNPLGG